MRWIGPVRLRLIAVTLPLLIQGITVTRAATSQDEICDVNADSALGFEDYSSAITLHQKVLRANDRNALAHYHLGFAYSMTGRETEEIAEYLTAAKLGLRKWDLFLNLGIAYLSQNDRLRAIWALQTAVLLGPSHPEAHFNLAPAYEKAHRLSEALKEVTASLDRAPEGPGERNTKGIICAELGDFSRTRTQWVHLLQVSPDYTPARVNLRNLDTLRSSVSSIPSALNTGQSAFAHKKSGVVASMSFNCCSQ